MSVKTHSSFIGVELQSSLGSCSKGNLFYWERRRLPERIRRRCRVSAKRSHWTNQAFRFSHLSGQNVELLRRDLVSRSGSRLTCIKEPFSRSKALVDYLKPLWKEGLLLIRAFVCTTVFSGLCLLAWYGQKKAKSFIEAKLLPSVCSVISEYIQREFELGKVKRISPLSMTLESCSFGPHEEEFTCGEVPTVKLSLRPFASLRRGKLVIDAVLSHPSILVVQKKDFTWLGLPLSERSPKRHFSAEEGIDSRTKIRRLAREEAAARWTRERDDAAKEAAEMGYFVSERCNSLSEGDALDEIAAQSTESTNSKSFFCMNEGKRDHHCMDTGIDYDMKHADLEKSFGVEVPGSGLEFWSRVVKGRRKNKFTKANGSDVSTSGVAIKRRILERSALAAHAYFRGQSRGKFEEPSQPPESFPLVNNMLMVTSQVDKIAESVHNGDEKRSDDGHSDFYKMIPHPALQTGESKYEILGRSRDVAEPAKANSWRVENDKLGPYVADNQTDDDTSVGQRCMTSESSASMKPVPGLATYLHVPIHPLITKFGKNSLFRNLKESLSNVLSGPIQKLKSDIGLKVEEIVAKQVEWVDFLQQEGIAKMLPVTLNSVHFRGGTVMLLAYGDREVRVIENVNGFVKFQNHYSQVHVQLSGSCQTWRSDMMSDDDGWLSANVFVDTIEPKWHANLKIDNLFVPLFERILEIPITWSKGRASGEVHLCLSKGETFPNLHGQLDVTGLDFQLLDAPSYFSNISASLRFRGQRIFLHNANGWFGSVPLEASGDFGIHPEEGEFHLMCQVPCVEVNALMRTFKMKPLLFPLAGSVTAVLNCQGPLYNPVFVGSGMVSRTFSHLCLDTSASPAAEALAKSKEAGALAAFDRVPFSRVSANFTFNTDNCVVDLYGIRATLVDGGEIRGAGNAWICPEGEKDDTAIDVNFSGNLAFDKIILRYVPSYYHLRPFKLGDLIGETKLSGSLLKPRFDIIWTAPKAEGSFNDARGVIIISHDYIVFNSSSAAFDLSMRAQTSYSEDFLLKREELYTARAIPLTVDGVELDIHMRGFEFFSFVSTYTFDSPRPLHLNVTGRIKFQGKVVKSTSITNEQSFENRQHVQMLPKGSADSLIGEVSMSGLKLNQLTLAPQLSGLLRVAPECIKLDATGRPDESLALEFVGPLQPSAEDSLQSGKLWSVSLQKGQLRANICVQPFHSANLEVRHFPLDELELASLRGTIQRAEVQLNLQKRKGHGVLSILRPKFSGVLGEALDVSARWSGDVITIEKAILEQNHSHYELQGEYVLPGTGDRKHVGKKGGGLFNKLTSGLLGSVISSMGRWRMKLGVHRAEVAEMLPFARLLSRSTDPAVRSRSKDFFIQSLPSVGLLHTGSLQQLLEMIRGQYAQSNDVILKDLSLPGLSELKGRLHGSLDASGGGNGDTVAEFEFHGENWEWGDYKTQCVLAVGAYSNDDGLHLEKIFIQKDNATIHADGTVLGPKTNLHFAVLNFPIGLVPTLVKVVESTATDVVHSLTQLLAPIKGILHMEGDLRGSLKKPECDVQVRLLDGAIGGIDLGRAEVIASLTPTNRFLFNVKLEPMIQNGHILIQGSVPVAFIQNNVSQDDLESDESGATWLPGWVKEKNRGTAQNSDKKVSTDRNTQFTERFKGLNWQILDVGEVWVDADIKDGGMMLLTALSPYSNWLHGNADIMLEVRGTVDQPVLNGYASFRRATVSSPLLQKLLTNFGGSVHIKSNRLCISSLAGRVSRKGKLLVKGNLPLRTSEASLGDKIELKCEDLEVRAKNILSGRVDSQMQITGSLLQPNISGSIKLSHGEAYLSHDKGGGVASHRFPSIQSMLTAGGVSPAVASRYISRFFSSEPAASRNKVSQSSDAIKSPEVENNMAQVHVKPNVDIRLSDLKLVLGPELKIVYPLILNFAVSGELELNGLAHPEWIKPKGILTFENGEVDLVATQVRLKRQHLNIAKFESEYGLDPMLDLALVGSECQFRIQGRASNWQDKLVVTSTRSVEQDALSATETARRFESQLAESILQGNGQLAFEKLATATVEKLMPRIEGKGGFGQARWKLVYAPQIPTLASVDPTGDPFKSLANNISFGTEVEVQLGKRLLATIVRQMKESEMATQWTLSYQLTSRLRVLLQSAASTRLLFEYSPTSQD